MIRKSSLPAVKISSCGIDVRIDRAFPYASEASNPSLYLGSRKSPNINRAKHISYRTDVQKRDMEMHYGARNNEGSCELRTMMSQKRPHFQYCLATALPTAIPCWPLRAS